ncbi:BrnT family toxin [Brevundimonas sp.]|uniref:BrnT family toxin n=1 Tax=Brevundimonas sp. TaxID=1871086 RepID=UPI00391C70EE
MRFEWDEEKARRNLARHKVAFDVAIKVFEDVSAVSVLDRVVDGEERWRTVGRVGLTTILFVAHTWLDESGEVFVRVISARKATPHEVQGYETGDEGYLR